MHSFVLRIGLTADSITNSMDGVKIWSVFLLLLYTGSLRNWTENFPAFSLADTFFFYQQLRGQNDALEEFVYYIHRALLDTIFCRKWRILGSMETWGKFEIFFLILNFQRYVLHCCLKWEGITGDFLSPAEGRCPVLRLWCPSWCGHWHFQIHARSWWGHFSHF